MPTAEEQWTLAKSVRRSTIKDNNFLRIQMWEYEDKILMGENLGNLGAGDGEDLDEAAAGELEEE